MVAIVLSVSPVRAQQGPVHELVVEILHEVVDDTRHRARERVRAYTGLDLLERGYRQHAEHHRFPPETSREITARELDRKLNKAQAEFKREAAREDKPGKV